MLHGTLWDKIPRFAVPVAATAILSQLFNAADIAVIGNFTGELRTVAVAAVGTNSSIISLIVNLFIGIALGANVTIAHAIGERNDTMVHHAVHTSIVVAVLGGLIAAIIGELFAVPLLNQLNVPDDVFPLALLYLRIYLAGLPVILLYNFEAAVFRSVGETKIPLIALTASGVLNVILNLFFVAALHMSVDGVAIATVLSNAVSAAILWGFLLKTDKVIRLEPKKLRIDGLCLKQILRIGVPAGVQSAMFSIANIVIQGAINSLGTVVMAASSAAYNIEVITYDILNSFSQACTTFVGQNFGAGEIKRCKKTLLLCLLEGIISLGVAIALILFFGKSLLTIFNGDPQVVETGYIRLMLIMPSHLFSLCYEVLTGYLRGFEISLPPAVLTMLGVCGVRLSWLRWVFPQYKTFMNIMLVFPISLATTALLMLAAVLYFAVFPSRLDTSGSWLATAYGGQWTPEALKTELGVTTTSYLIQNGLLAVTLAPLANMIPAVGEEAGWRGYMMPRLKERLGLLNGRLLGGVIWGVWHWPLMLLVGYEYGTNYLGAPLLGLVVWCVVCFALNTLLDWLYEKTGCIWVPAIAHGALNAVASMPVVLTDPAEASYYTVLGPMPIGLIGMLPVLAVAVWLTLRQMKQEEKS